MLIRLHWPLVVMPSTKIVVIEAPGLCAGRLANTPSCRGRAAQMLPTQSVLVDPVTCGRCEFSVVRLIVAATTKRVVTRSASAQ